MSYQKFVILPDSPSADRAVRTDLGSNIMIFAWTMHAHMMNMTISGIYNDELIVKEFYIFNYFSKQPSLRKNTECHSGSRNIHFADDTEPEKDVEVIASITTDRHQTKEEKNYRV